MPPPAAALSAGAAARAGPLGSGYTADRRRAGDVPRGACAARAPALDDESDLAASGARPARSHRSPSPGRRAPATELFLVRSRRGARARADGCPGRALPRRNAAPRAVSCSRAALPALGVRAARVSRSVPLSPPAAPVKRRRVPASVSSPRGLPAFLPRAARPGVSPRPAPSAPAARAPPAAPTLG